MHICPRCESDSVVSRDRAKKVGSALGAITGAAWGIACVMRGAQAGAFVGTMKGPTGSLLSLVANAALAGLAGAVAIGQALDASVLDNHQCLACGYTFDPIFANRLTNP
ncbi:hypothetical protein VLK31_20790 [Variovorax sp. H27-G14]|uniref:hypothetical protein n=1 Tax=Variovorax sp. H27-G14 TaxID=3111914 RepID=UPI0038FC64A0